MMKRVMSMLMVMIMMVGLLSVSVFAVDHSAHSDKVSADWSQNETAHWHACADDACAALSENEQAGYGAHVWSNGICVDCSYACQHAWVDDGTDAICKKCNLSHTHTLTYVTTDADNHWQVCSGCVVDAEKKYNVGAHSWEKADDASTANVEYKCSVCDKIKAVHECEWTLVNTDAAEHYYQCSGCGETKDRAAHVWVDDADNTTATNKAYKCSTCGAVKGEHVHVWETTLTWDEHHHWYACADSSCDAITGKNIHWDYNGTGVCDEGDCGAAVTGNTFKTLTITGLTEPAEGAAVDFTINVAEVGYDIPLVKVNWNRVTNLSKGTSEALGATSTYTAGYMYSVGIVVPVTWNDTIDDNIQITLNGHKVPYYSAAAFEAAQKTFEGKETVYMAKVANVNGKQAVVIGVMYPKLAGTHVCTFGSDWIETPAKHYYMCTGCGETKNAEYHYDNNKSGLCDVCGFDMKYFNKNATATSGTGTATGHAHAYSTDWVEDISNHWKQCTGCGAVIEKAAHADLNNTGKCDVCGFVMKAEAGHTHTFASEWTETFAQHYKVCSCGAKNEIAAHVDLNNTGKCDTCGYAMTTLSNNGIVADTGDDNATFLWMAAFAVSVLGAAATVVVARKKREE